jgi:hypothetical protein
MPHSGSRVRRPSRERAACGPFGGHTSSPKAQSWRFEFDPGVGYAPMRAAVTTNF